MRACEARATLEDHAEARATLEDHAYGASCLPKQPKTTVLQSTFGPPLLWLESRPELCVKNPVWSVKLRNFRRKLRFIETTDFFISFLPQNTNDDKTRQLHKSN